MRGRVCSAVCMLQGLGIRMLLMRRIHAGGAQLAPSSSSRFRNGSVHAYGPPIMEGIDADGFQTLPWSANVLPPRQYKKKKTQPRQRMVDIWPTHD
jgi:hypothetical protein